MKLEVLSNYDNVDMVEACNLKRLIADKKIQAFRRQTGWVRLGSDMVRGEGGADYDGPERRNIIQKPLTTDQKNGMFRCIIGIKGPVSDW